MGAVFYFVALMVRARAAPGASAVCDGVQGDVLLQVGQKAGVRPGGVETLPPPYDSRSEALSHRQLPRSVIVMLEGSSAQVESPPSEKELELYRLTTGLREQ